MSEHSRVIAECIDKLGNKRAQTRLIDAEVVSVDEPSRTCTVNSEDENIDGLVVRLVSSISDGEVDIPAVGSTITIAYSQYTQAQIVSKSYLDKKTIIVGDVQILAEPSLLTLNDGSYGGLIIIEKLVDKINRLEDAYNDLVNKYNAHTHPYVNVSAPAVTSVTTSLETPIQPKTQKSDIENETIKHGKLLS